MSRQGIGSNLSRGVPVGGLTAPIPFSFIVPIVVEKRRAFKSAGRPGNGRFVVMTCKNASDVEELEVTVQSFPAG